MTATTILDTITAHINTITSSSNISALALAVSVFAIFVSFAMFGSSGKKKKFNPNGKHCFITGGSLGLGKSLARQLIDKGANVTIAARNEKTLQEAVKELEKSRVNDDQVITFVSADVSSYESVSKAFDNAATKVGSVPEYVFCCAGQAIPGYFLEQDPSVFEHHVKVNYLGAVNTAKAAASKLIQSKIQHGRIVFVGSTLSLMGLTGYSAYAPTKAALRSIADCLRQELLPYNIHVSIYLPGTILSPGHAQEDKTKPEITKKLEGSSAELTPDQCAQALISGLNKGRFMITSDFDTDIIRASVVGMSPRGNVVWDVLLGLIGMIALPIVRMSHDSAVRKNGRKGSEHFVKSTE